MKRSQKKQKRLNDINKEANNNIIAKYRSDYLAGDIIGIDLSNIRDNLGRFIYAITIVRKDRTNAYPIRNIEFAKQLLEALDVIYYVDLDGMIQLGSNVGEANYDN